MPGKSIGYIRVSTVDQNTDRQLIDVQLDKVFEDKVSGSTRASTIFAMAMTSGFTASTVWLVISKTCSTSSPYSAKKA